MSCDDQALGEILSSVIESSPDAARSRLGRSRAIARSLLVRRPMNPDHRRGHR